MTSPFEIEDAKSWIIYDGDCPYCRNYVKFLKLKDAVGRVDLINARGDDTRIKDAVAQGFDLNEGMIFYHNEAYHYGSDAVHIMALMSTQSSVFNKINTFIFKHEKLAKFLYPFMKCGRNITLKVLRKDKLSV